MSRSLSRHRVLSSLAAVLAGAALFSGCGMDAGSAAGVVLEASTLPACQQYLVFSASGIGNRVVSYRMDSCNGSLNLVSQASPPAGSSPRSLASAFGGRRLYAVNAAGASAGSASLSVYSIASTGVLAHLATSDLPGMSGARRLATTPDGRFLYVTASAANQLAAFSIDPVDGHLTALAASPFTVSSGPDDLAVSPDGKRLYVSVTGAVVHFDHSGTTGAPAQAASYSTGADAATLRLSPDGSLLYAASAASETIFGFRVSSTDGSLALAGGASGFSAAPGPSFLAFYTDAPYLFAGEPASDSVTTFQLGNGGSLIPIESLPLSEPGAGPSRAQVLPVDGRFLVVAESQAGEVAVLDVNPLTGTVAERTAFLLDDPQDVLLLPPF